MPQPQPHRTAALKLIAQDRDGAAAAHAILHLADRVDALARLLGRQAHGIGADQLTGLDELARMTRERQDALDELARMTRERLDAPALEDALGREGKTIPEDAIAAAATDRQAPPAPDIAADVAAAIASDRTPAAPVLLPLLAALSSDLSRNEMPQGGARCPGIVSTAGGTVRCLLADRHEDQRSQDPRHLAYAIVAGAHAPIRWSDHPDQPPAPSGVA